MSDEAQENWNKWMAQMTLGNPNFITPTMRDYFAAAVLTGLLERDRGQAILNSGVFAKTCYDLADAMLKARGETNAN